MKYRHLARSTMVGVALALILTAACASEPERRAEGTEGVAVSIRAFMFVPGTVRVNVGESVSWSNEDDIAHTVTSGRPGEGGIPGVSEEAAPTPDGIFDESLGEAGDRASVTFEEAGAYPYFCAIHDGMTGVVEVV